MKKIALLLLLFTKGLISQNKNSDFRIEMSDSEFEKIEAYEDSAYLTENYYEVLFSQVRANLLNPETYEQTYNSLSKGQKIFWGYATLSGEIENGGIVQYYWNTMGALVKDIPAILKVVKDPELNRLLTECNQIFRKNEVVLQNYRYLGDQNLNNGVNYYSLWADFFKDEKFTRYFLAHRKEIELKMFLFIKTHPKHFIKQ